MSEFYIRDPIHGWIECSNREKEIINSPLVQRLKWVMQLSAVYHVYNGGTHTRFAHSLGVMHIAGLYMTHLFKSSFINTKSHNSEHYIQVARLAGLLHDIGHGPFSHLFDHIVYQKMYNNLNGHDIARLELIQSELLKPYILNCGVTPDEISMVWSDEIPSNPQYYIYYIIGSVIQGPLGADRIDFTLRDSYYTGTEHLGTISHTRIISNSGVTGLVLWYNDKAIRDIISALDSRLYLYHDVYFHKTSMAASLIIEEMLLASCDDLKLIERTKDFNQFRFLNDTSVIGELTNARTKGGEYCRQLLERKLPKLVKEEMVLAGTEYSEEEYYTRWNVPSTPEFKFIRTRVISGISAKKFEQRNIKFRTKSGELISCEEALKNIMYQPSQPPYYIVRLYKFKKVYTNMNNANKSE
jgi:hypothetical protein